MGQSSQNWISDHKMGHSFKTGSVIMKVGHSYQKRVNHIYKVGQLPKNGSAIPKVDQSFQNGSVIQNWVRHESSVSHPKSDSIKLGSIRNPKSGSVNQTLIINQSKNGSVIQKLEWVSYPKSASVIRNASLPICHSIG